MEKLVSHILYQRCIRIIDICESVSNHENVYVEDQQKY